MKKGESTIRSSKPYQRRRRKRNRPQPTSGRAEARDGSVSITKGKSGFSCSSNRLRLTQDFCQDDHKQFSFLDKDGDELVNGRPQFRSLPILLEERRSGVWQAKHKKWQCETLFNFTKKPIETYIGRRQWRAFAKQKIPFTRLGSPPSDAVLAMERNGDYVLTLGIMDDTCTGLALRFHGIHSAASRKRLQPSNRHRDIRSNYVNNVLRAPLLQTTPLYCGTRRLHRAPTDSVADGEILDHHRDVSPSTTPVELIISKDWKVGVALLYPTITDGPLQMDSQDINNNANNGNTASMVFFTLPRRQFSSRTINNGIRNDVNVIFKCNNVPMFRNDDSRRKMLWSVESIPNKDETSPNLTRNVYHTYFRTPGYLLCNDEGNGVRLTWATEKCFLVSSCLSVVSIDSRFVSGLIGSAGVKILSHQQQNSSWTEAHYNKMTGEAIAQDLNADSTSESLSAAQVSIVNESFLQLDVLLADVLSRRKGISETRPDFCFSLISVNRSGRIADFVIVFTRKNKACSLGFYVKIDLFSGMFVELDWLRSKGKKETFSLRKWCNKLAVNRRMQYLRAGPFAVTEKHALDCTRLCRETFTFDNDEEDDYDESYWREFVLDEKNSEGKKRCQAPKLVTLSSLYPSCDIITNQAIINFEPVMSIRAKDSPIQLVYT